VVERMRTNIEVETVRDDAFKISFVSPSRGPAMIVADRLASMFIDETAAIARDGEWHQHVPGDAAESARSRLIAHEKKLEEFRRRKPGAAVTAPDQSAGHPGHAESVQNLSESINRDRGSPAGAGEIGRRLAVR